MVVILDGKGLEAPLPDVASGAVMAMVAPGVRREQRAASNDPDLTVVVDAWDGLPEAVVAH